MTEQIECPACCDGLIFPRATVGMWAGLVEWDAQAYPCELCDGTGEVTVEVAGEWERRNGDD